MSRTAFAAALVVVALAAGGVSGCGRGLPPPCWVKGKITFAGAPVEKGAIRFVTDAGTPGTGGVGAIRGGEYEVHLDGMLSGKYLVVISGFRLTGKMLQIEPTIAMPEEVQYLPARYNTNSQEYVELSPGENVKDFDLQP